MTARALLRGHEIYWDGEQFRYKDDDAPTVGNERTCGHCGIPNTEDGHDGCLGYLPGVMNACCGHGQENEAYVQFPDHSVVRGEDATAVIQAMKGYSP